MPQMSHDNERTLWRSAQAMETGVAASDASREFSEGASESAGFSRRGFMQIMAASMALAGAASCRRPEEKILPYNQAPEGLIPGKANFYASAIPAAAAPSASWSSPTKAAPPRSMATPATRPRKAPAIPSPRPTCSTSTTPIACSKSASKASKPPAIKTA